jgi:peptide/nickel transport system substrate-binding protein
MTPFLTRTLSAVIMTMSMAWTAGADALVETPSLADAVKRGDIPPVAQRIPDAPLVVKLDSDVTKLGRHGGTLNMLIGRQKDVRLLVVYGYARLMGYDSGFNLQPDILESFEVRDGRIFTFNIRKGHKWSDGHPFTAEDFRYYWEDVANNSNLAPSGPPRDMIVAGEPAHFEVIDDVTVRYTWPVPNPFFLPRLAGASPLFIYRPAHYLRQFHPRYVGEAAAAERAEAEGQRSWAPLHNRRDNLYNFDNPDLPTLQPWRNTTRRPATRFAAHRNPYFHRIDSAGRQLPYIDEVVMIQADGRLISAKTGAGESDLQARNISFSDYTFLKDGSKRNDYEVHLWRTAKGAHLALFPNLNHNDPAWRSVMRDHRFRKALSLAIDRPLINQALYFGLALEHHNTVLPESPLYKQEYSQTDFDIDRANAYLDEMGLTERDDDETRLLPDGKPIHIIVETAGEDTEQTDVLELIRDDWAKIGIKLFTKPSQREVFRNRIFSGETLMSIWFGLENGLATADMSPEELAPTSQLQLQWPKWGQYFETKGKSGEPPDMASAVELARLNEEWLGAASTRDREQIWQRMLQIHRDMLFSIGIVSGVLQPVVAKRNLMNVPGKAVYNWDPGAHFGVYRPDTFWFAE